MATFAVIENNVVVNTISAESLEVAQEVTNNATCVEYFMVESGWTYADGKFTAPVVEEITVVEDAPIVDETPAE
jgi:hypothetical protein